MTLESAPAAGEHTLYLAAGCFWGVERLFWSLPGVTFTQVGYQGGSTPHPSYEQVCSGTTGHAEVVRVDFDPSVTSVEQVLKVYWENHDPTTKDQQGNDRGTQYRSAIFYGSPELEGPVRASAALFQVALNEQERGTITTQIDSAEAAGPFYPAEEYHQRYLEKNPGGYCNHGFKGVTCPIPDPA